MLAFVASMLLATQPVQPPPTIDLDTLTLADVRQFDGKTVTAHVLRRNAVGGDLCPTSEPLAN